MLPDVGASLLAMVVNDNACLLAKRGALESIASKLAPTGDRVFFKGFIMQALNNLNLTSLLDTLVSLSAAFVLGGLIGFERQYRQRTAGLRTNVLVAVGAAIFVDMANRLAGAEGAVRVVAYVVSGIGFLGAGVIMREEGNVRGLNTAATLWTSAAVGACAGADLLAEALLGTLFVLAANTLLRPIVNSINRQPLDVISAEVTNIVYVIARRTQQKTVLALLEAELERSNYPASDVDVHAFGTEEIEIEATLATTSVDGDELDALVARISTSTLVVQAFWSPSTTE
ncbi:putative membrane protein [Pseudomonas sp. GM33]|nr:putative membrane protein [Pseudomonas sp. GM33]